MRSSYSIGEARIDQGTIWKLGIEITKNKNKGEKTHVITSEKIKSICENKTHIAFYG